jgi:hypothetical protein
MNGSIRKVAVGVSVVVLSTLILWLASHALRAEAFMVSAPVKIDSQQKQLDRIENKVDWLIELEMEQRRE